VARRPQVGLAGALPVVSLLLSWVAVIGAASAQPAEKRTNHPTSFKPDFEPNLPVFVLTARGSIDKAQKTLCTLSRIVPGAPQPGVSNSWAGEVKLHGGVSVGFPKNSYGITLAVPARLLDLRESTHWVLNAAFIDRSLMRHKLSYDLFRSLDAPGARRFAAGSRFVELYLNGDYRGAYLLMERVDGRLLELRRFGSNETSHACIYKAVDHAANFGQPGHAGYEQREPDALAKEYWQPLDEFNRFVSQTSDAEFFNPQDGIGSRLDLANTVDFYLLVLLTSNQDGITKNFIIARDALRETSPKPKFFFAPWDYDATFGRNWDASKVAPSAWLSNHLFDRLMGDRAFREQLARRWKELREGQFSARTIQSMIETNARTLGEAAWRNTARWRPAAGNYPDQLTFDEDVAQMKTWVEARIQWLDTEIQRRTAPGQ
jgi:spore coat protein H